MRALALARSLLQGAALREWNSVSARGSLLHGTPALRGLASLIEDDDELATGFDVADMRPVRKWPLDDHGRIERTAKARRLGISTSPHKLNLVARLVRGMTVTEAQRQLVGCRKFHSQHVAATILAAQVNARSHGLREERLVVQHAFVGKGRYLKKIRPWHGKGRHGIEEKKYAHLTIVLRELDDEMWEQTVLPQYVHMQYRSPKEQQKKQKEFNIEGWTTVSELDTAFRDTHERVQGLRDALEGK